MAALTIKRKYVEISPTVSEGLDRLAGLFHMSRKAANELAIATLLEIKLNGGYVPRTNRNTRLLEILREKAERNEL
jgi:hypothetical protein